MAIRHKRKATSGYVWSSADLVEGQIGINIADGSLHIRKADSAIAAIESLSVSSYIKTLLDDTTATAARSTLGAASSGISISAGTGLAGGGTLTASRTLSLSSATQTSLGLADTAVQPAAIANFETTTQLNSRDSANRSRSNHTGTQLISTISGLQTALDARQPLDSDLTAISGLGTTGAIERTGAGTATTFSVSAFAKTLLDDATATAARTTLGAADVNHNHDLTYALLGHSHTTADLVIDSDVKNLLDQTTPAGMRGALELNGRPFAWVNFAYVGSTLTIRGSSNVSSVARVSAGQYTVNFSTAAPSINFAVLCTKQNTVSNDNNCAPHEGIASRTTSSCRVISFENNNLVDSPNFSVLVFI